MSVVQIAAQAGVSIATVSRVLNNSRRVNPKLADQVHRAMAQLNFTPSQIRRRPSARRTEQQASTIAIVTLGQRYRQWFENPVLSAVVAEITRAAVDHHLGTLITEMTDPHELSPVLRRQSVDGALVFVDSSLPPRASAYLAEHLPIVRVMGGQMAALEVDHVAPDNNAVGYLACQTLLEQGCRRLAYATTRPTWDLSKLRGQGFAAAALSIGRRPHVFIEGPADDLDCVYGSEMVAAPDFATLAKHIADAVRASRGGDGPFGLFVSRDEETVGLYRLLAENGVRPGADLTIVSCDNERVRLAGLRPRPMSIDLNPAEIARHAVARLMERIKRPHHPPVRMLVNPTVAYPEPEQEANGQAAVAALAATPA